MSGAEPFLAALFASATAAAPTAGAAAGAAAAGTAAAGTAAAVGAAGAAAAGTAAAGAATAAAAGLTAAEIAALAGGVASLGSTSAALLKEPKTPNLPVSATRDLAAEEANQRSDLYRRRGRAATLLTPGGAAGDVSKPSLGAAALLGA